MKNTILFLEDDPVVSKTLFSALELSGFTPTLCSTVKEAQEKLRSGTWDALLLDVNLPDGKGYTICEEARRLNPNAPIIMLSANSDEDSAVRALSGGAIDYVRKPAGVKEITIRLKKAMGSYDKLNVGSVGINCTNRTVDVHGNVVDLRRREFDILAALAVSFGRVMKREELLEKIRASEDVSDRAIDSHLSRLRKKLKDAGAEDIAIKSIYGVGYTFTRAA